MSFYSVLKTSYKTFLPKPVRKAVYRHMPKTLKAVRKAAIRKLEKSVEFDDIYDEKYYTDVLSPRWEKSFEVIAESIMKVFSPRSVVDVGCGIGLLLLAIKKRGVICRGLEYSSAGLNMCHRNGLDVARFDLSRDILPKDLRSDVVVSTEVAEHLPERCADRFVGVLCAIADNVVMTAAEPAHTYVGDHTHANEQPKEYWIAKFAQKGFKYDENISTKFRTEWKQREISPWFVQHLMVFRKEHVGRSRLSQKTRRHG